MNVRATAYRLAYPFYRFYRDLFHVDGAGAACVLQCGDEILLIRNTYGNRKWTFPGGMVNKGETMAEAAIRETKEEVGISIESVEDHGFFEHGKNKHHDTVHVFSAKVRERSLNVDPGEIAEARWFSREEASHLDLSDIGQKILERF